MTPRKQNPKWLNRRPDVQTSEIVQRYAAGESSKVIAASLGCSTRTVALRLASAGVAMRPMGKIKTFASGHGHNWKGDDVQYHGSHCRVYKSRGRPSHCEVCGTSEQRMYHWANLTGNYADPSDYARMCVPCHRRYDYLRRKAPVLEAIRNSTASGRSLERLYGVDHRVIREVRRVKAYTGSDVLEAESAAVASYFRVLNEVQERLLLMSNGVKP